MRLNEVLNYIDSDTVVKICDHDHSTIYGADYRRKLRHEDYERVARYMDCDVLSIKADYDAKEIDEAFISIDINAHEEIKVRFWTDHNGFEFEDAREYNRLDFEDDEEMNERIEEDLQDWVDDIVADIRGYAEWEER